MSDTPRTDAIVKGGVYTSEEMNQNFYQVLIHARQLERELASAKRDADHFYQLSGKYLERLNEQEAALRSATAKLEMPRMDEILLACGEMTASERRCVRTALEWFIRRVDRTTKP